MNLYIEQKTEQLYEKMVEAIGSELERETADEFPMRCMKNCRIEGIYEAATNASIIACEYAQSFNPTNDREIRDVKKALETKIRKVPIGDRGEKILVSEAIYFMEGILNEKIEAAYKDSNSLYSLALELAFEACIFAQRLGVDVTVSKRYIKELNKNIDFRK